MGTKRIGLARVEALIENLKRDLNLSGATLGGLALGAQTVAAAGNGSLAQATAISATAGSVVLVTGADDTKAVALPAIADLSLGHLYIIHNSVTNKALEVLPQAADKVSPAADGASITVAAGATLVVAVADATQWIGFEPTVIAA